MLKCLRKTLLVGISISTASSFVDPAQHLYPNRVLRVTHPLSVLGRNDEDAAFYVDLREAKKAKFGSDLPQEQLKESSKSSELEFLNAMKQVKQEFQDAKETLGLDGAVEMIIERLRKDDIDENRASGIHDRKTLDDELQ
jgi:hypothetical protein